MNNLAVAYQEPASWTWPCRSSRKRSSSRKAKLGPDHPDTLTSMNNLALATRPPGSWTWPCRSTRKRSSSRKPSSAPIIPDTLSSMNNLAWLPGCRQAGPGPAALRADAQAPESQTRTRSSRHARHHEQPGHGLRDAGKAGGGFADAEPLLRECLAIREKIAARRVDDVRHDNRSWSVPFSRARRSTPRPSRSC